MVGVVGDVGDVGNVGDAAVTLPFRSGVDQRDVFITEVQWPSSEAGQRQRVALVSRMVEERSSGTSEPWHGRVWVVLEGDAADRR